MLKSSVKLDIPIQTLLQIITGGVTIEEGAIIQAGSVVVSNIPYCAIAGGHPAKVFKYRDISHYEELKEKKLFH